MGHTFKRFFCLILVILLLWDFAYESRKSLEYPYKAPSKLIDYSLNIFSRIALADQFMNTVREGKNLGNEILPQYKTENVNDTLQQKGLGTVNQITPRAQEAEQSQGNYKQYYTNPGGMSSAPLDQEMQTYIEDIYHQSEPIEKSYRSDQTFGNKCLVPKEGGGCNAWSLSDKILYENFPDCEKVVTPTYDNPQDLQKCIATKTEPTISDICEVSAYFTVQTETVHTPCSMQSSTFVPNQIYAVCKDYYTWYRVPGGSNRRHNTAVNFVALSSSSQLPAGAQWGFDGSTDQDYSYSWYYKYEGSKVERLVLSTTNSCGTNFQEMSENCAALYVELCDQNWNNCVKVLEDGEPTGLLPEMNHYLMKYYAGTTTKSCSEACQLQKQTWGFRVFCPSGQCEGLCNPDAPTITNTSGLTLVGVERTLKSENCYDASEPEEPPPPPPPGSPPPPPPQDDPGDFVIGGTVTYDEIQYYIDRRVCRNVAGGIEDYVVCLKGDKIEIDNGGGFKEATNPATRVDGSCQEADVLTVTYYYLYGGPDLGNQAYFWNARVRFSCGGEEDDESACKPLIDRGCVYHSHICLDSDCYQKEYTYNCGGTGQIKGYDVKYICADGLRCIGTECHDASYEANDDFIQAATAFTILNNYRADADPGTMQVFPGDKSECQSSPKNCCEKPGVGITIGDYIRFGLAAIKVYSLLSSGIVATWASFAATATHLLGGGNVFIGLGGLLGIYNPLNTTIVTTSVIPLTTSPAQVATAIGAELSISPSGGYFVHINAGLVQNLATIMTVVTVALVVYSIFRFVYDFIFRCTKEDIITSYKVGLNLCHYIGIKKKKFLGVTYKRKKVYCCFNTILARLVHECVRPQIGRGWGDANSPDCGGLTPGELSSADFSKCDFTEYMQHVQFKTELKQEDIDRIRQKLEDKYKKR